jgi:hypothetical protein
MASFIQYPNEDIQVVEDGDKKIHKYECILNILTFLKAI